MKKYQITKEECQKKIDELGNVCDRCGGKIEPMETEDNSGNPTYWAGCWHGNQNKDFGHFTSGVKKEIFDLAEKLVQDGETFYSFGDKSDYGKTPEQRLNWFQREVCGMTHFLNKVEFLRNGGEPHKTKEEFLQEKSF